MALTMKNLTIRAPGGVLCFALAGIVQGGITPIGPGSFSGSATVITFDEVAVGTSIPFTIGIADFVGLAGATSNFGSGSSLPPGPSGVPYLQSGSVGNDDVIEIEFGADQQMVGAYFNIQGAGTTFTNIQLEFYSGLTLLGTIAAVPDAGTFGGFVGGDAGAAVIDRIIFRDMDTTTPISFRIDDLMFQVPSPGALGLLALAMLGHRRRR